jgi:hypothetical protein
MNENIWDNNTGARVIIDCWSDETYSYAIILYPNGVLHFQWIVISK